MSADIFKVAVESVRSVGERLRAAQISGNGFEIRHKGAVDLVTELDLWSEQELSARILKAFPDHLIVGEESAEALVRTGGKTLKEICAKGVCWIIDPIDGTTNFANLIPHFAVSVGVMLDGRLIAGFVFDPMRDELFYALKGQGAFLNGRPIRVSAKRELVNAVIATGVPYDRVQRWDEYRDLYEKFLIASRDLRRFGCASLDLCWLACGRFDGYFEYGLKPWDVAGGSMILEEAGGLAANIGAAPGDLFSIFHTGFMFAGKELLPEMLRAADRTFAQGETDGKE